MKSCVFSFCFLLGLSGSSGAYASDSLSPEETDSVPVNTDTSLINYYDSVEASLRYRTGEVPLEKGAAVLRIPEKFKYLDPAQSETVLTQLWGNPSGESLGMIFPENMGPLSDNSWAFVLSFDEIGYVKDEDADDINYDELLDDMRKDMDSANDERQKMGYERVELVGWAAKPFYDKQRKALHWAKELKFGDNESNTLNYNVRVLGRKGVMVLNAVGNMEQLDEVKSSIGNVLDMVSFADGHKYSDFNPKVDEVAAWTIGGLVAGKVLAKAGFFALILKNIKLIFIALAAAGGGMWRWLSGRYKEA